MRLFEAVCVFRVLFWSSSIRSYYEIAIVIFVRHSKLNLIDLVPATKINKKKNPKEKASVLPDTYKTNLQHVG